MSATSPSGHELTIERCRPVETTPVSLDASTLDSVARSYLRELKTELAENGYTPAHLDVEACFDENCSLATQDEVDRVREYVAAAAFLGADSVTVRVDEIADEAKVRPALSACVERARRDGVALDVDGPLAL